MSSRLVLLALLVGCGPKQVTTEAPVPATSAAPAASTTAAPPEPTPTQAVPAAAPVTTPALDNTPAAPEGAALAPATPVAAAGDPVTSQVNDAAAMLTTADPGRAQRALELLQAQASQRPDLAAIHYNIGVAHQQLGQEAEARRAWTRATEVDPTFAKAWVNLGALNARSGRLDLALASFQAGTRYNAQNIDLRVASINALRQLKRYEDAVAEAKSALLINSKAIPIYNELAMVYLDTGKYELARFTLQKAVAEIDGAKGNARLHAVLGEVYYRLGYSGDAVASFQKSLELDPFQLPALLYLSSYYLDNRAWTDATPLLERALKLAPQDAGVLLNLGISYRGERRFEDAKKAYEEALRLRPSDPEPYRNLAVLYGDYMKAYDAALQAIEQYRRAGGGPAAELDGWIASIKKEQERIEKQRQREERQRRDDEARRQQEEAERAAAAAAEAAAAAAAAQPVAPSPDGSGTPVSPDGTAPSPGGPPQPAPESPPAQPAPESNPAPSPWGG